MLEKRVENNKQKLRVFYLFDGLSFACSSDGNKYVNHHT